MKIPGLVLALLILILACPGIVDVSAQPFTVCWSFPSDELSRLEIASDNINQIFIPLTDGNVQSVELKTGALLWKSELGGEIAAQLLFKAGMIFAVVRNSSENAVNLKALSSKTGIAIWQTGIIREKNEEFRLAARGDDIYLISSNGTIQNLEGKTGRVKLSLNLKNPVGLPPPAHKKGSDFILISKTGSGARISRYSAEKGERIASASVGYGSRILLFDENAILTGDPLGNVSLYSAEKLKRIWTIRTGAEVGDVVETPLGYMLSSKDNFVYLVSKEKGRRIWKTRLPERAFGTLFGSEIGVFSSTDGTESVFIETVEGRVVNRITLVDENFFTSKPLVIGRFFIAPTARGVFAYSQSACQTKGARQ